MTVTIALGLLVLIASEDPRCQAAQADINQARQHLAQDNIADARRDAEEAVSQAQECVEAHLLVASVVDRQLASAGGLGALRLSRRYRRAIQSALDIEPDSIEARMTEIGYLTHAPGIAGGDRERAADRITELRNLSPLAAAEASLELARANGETEEILPALEALIRLAPDRYILRSELARRLIIAGNYESAEAELIAWDPGPEWIVAEQNYLRGALRTLGETDLDAAVDMLRLTIRHPCLETAPRCVDQANAASLLGRALELTGDHQGAHEAYSASLNEDPENARALAGLSRLDDN